MDVNLEIGKKYTKWELQEILETGFAGPFGIEPRTWRKNTAEEQPYISIFCLRNGPYKNRIVNNKLYYVGEGLKQDQKIKRMNKSLAEAKDKGKPILGFRRDGNGNKWEYMGILNLLGYKEDQIKEKDDEKVYKQYIFELEITNVSSPNELKIEDAALEELSEIDDPPLTDNSPKYVTVYQKAREQKFREKLREAYGSKCAVCGKIRMDKLGNPEAEASHIYPKEHGGPDIPKNGILLCKFHHWAFDKGLFSINDNFTILVNKDIPMDDNYSEIYEYDGQKIQIPKENKYKPHLKFLKKHREISGFEN